MLWALTALSVLSGVIYLWRGSRMVTDRKLTGELILVVVVAWVVGLLMSASIPYGLGIEVGSLAAVLWGWSPRRIFVKKLRKIA